MKNVLSLLTLACVAAAPMAASASDLFDNYNFDTAAQAHASARTMTASRGNEVVGIFKMIATASRSYRGDFQKKDVNGIANQDGSILGLQLATQSTGDLVQVIQTNLGKLDQNQGPSVVAYTETGSMAFAQFSYKDGQVSDDVFFHSECRLLADRMLLCAKRFMVQNPSAVNPQQAAMNNTIVGYDLYTR